MRRSCDGKVSFQRFAPQHVEVEVRDRVHGVGPDVEDRGGSPDRAAASPAASATARAASSMSARTGPSSAVTVDASSIWRRGTTSTWSGAAGWMSLKATVVGVSCTVSDGTSPATILQNRHRVGHAPGSPPSFCAGLITGTELTGPRALPVTMGARHARPDPSAAATVPVRREAKSAPAVTAAVSARRTLNPNPTVGSPDASSSVLHPPSGPTATTRWAAVGRSPLSWASTTSPVPPRAGQVAEAHRVAHLGQPDAAALRRRFARHPAQPLDRRLAPRAGPADDAALAAQRHDAIDAQLGQLLDDPLGPLALDRREGDRERRLGAGLGLHARRRRHRSRGERLERGLPPPCGCGPAAASVGGDDLLAVAESQHPRPDGGRPRRKAPGARGRPRTTWAAAAARTAMRGVVRGGR